eukprot:gene12139-13274_t
MMESHVYPGLNQQTKEYGIIITHAKYLITSVYRNNCFLQNDELPLPPPSNEEDVSVYFLSFKEALNRSIRAVPIEKQQKLQRLKEVSADQINDNQFYIGLKIDGEDRQFGLSFTKPSQIGDLLVRTKYFHLLPDSFMLPKTITSQHVLFLPLFTILSSETLSEPFLLLARSDVTLYSTTEIVPDSKPASTSNSSSLNVLDVPLLPPSSSTTSVEVGSAKQFIPLLRSPPKKATATTTPSSSKALSKKVQAPVSQVMTSSDAVDEGDVGTVNPVVVEGVMSEGPSVTESTKTNDAIPSSSDSADQSLRALKACFPTCSDDVLRCYAFRLPRRMVQCQRCQTSFPLPKCSGTLEEHIFGRPSKTRVPPCKQPLPSPPLTTTTNPLPATTSSSSTSATPSSSNVTKPSLSTLVSGRKAVTTKMIFSAVMSSAKPTSSSATSPNTSNIASAINSSSELQSPPSSTAYSSTTSTSSSPSTNQPLPPIHTPPLDIAPPNSSKVTEETVQSNAQPTTNRTRLPARSRGLAAIKCSGPPVSMETIVAALKANKKKKEEEEEQRKNSATPTNSSSEPPPPLLSRPDDDSEVEVEREVVQQRSKRTRTAPPTRFTFEGPPLSTTASTRRSALRSRARGMKCAPPQGLNSALLHRTEFSYDESEEEGEKEVENHKKRKRGSGASSSQPLQTTSIATSSTASEEQILKRVKREKGVDDGVVSYDDVIIVPSTPKPSLTVIDLISSDEEAEMAKRRPSSVVTPKSSAPPSPLPHASSASPLALPSLATSTTTSLPSLPTIEEILSKYGITAETMGSVTSEQFPPFTSSLPSYVPDTSENFTLSTMFGDSKEFNRRDFNSKWSETLKRFWTCTHPSGDHMKESYFVARFMTFSYSHKVLPPIQNLDFFYLKDMLTHVREHACLSMNGGDDEDYADDLWTLLMSFGWKEKERENHVTGRCFYYSHASRYVSKLTMGFHMFHSFRAMSEYVQRFPYPLQPDIQLITSLQRLGWEVDSSKNEVRHLNQWKSLEEMRRIFWSFPHLYFLPRIKPIDEDRVLLSIGLPKEYAQLHDERAATFPPKKNRTFSRLLLPMTEINNK